MDQTNETRTYATQASIDAIIRSCSLPRCVCYGADGKDICFRIVPESPQTGLCTACLEGYHGPGGKHGYAGTVQ